MFLNSPIKEHYSVRVYYCSFTKRVPKRRNPKKTFKKHQYRGWKNHGTLSHISVPLPLQKVNVLQNFPQCHFVMSQCQFDNGKLLTTGDDGIIDLDRVGQKLMFSGEPWHQLLGNTSHNFFWLLLQKRATR